MKKLLPLLVCLVLAGCSNWQLWSAGTSAAGITSLIDVGVTYSATPQYWIDLCVLGPGILRLSSGWDGEAKAAGFLGGTLVAAKDVKGCPNGGHG